MPPHFFLLDGEVLDVDVLDVDVMDSSRGPASVRHQDRSLRRIFSAHAHFLDWYQV